MAPKPTWIIKAPRVLLVVIFPVVSFILYLILSLGCANTTLSAVSPFIVTSNGAVAIGGVPTRVDMRIGFWGICFGPDPYFCASSFTVIPTRTAAGLARIVPANRGGGNLALMQLALGLQQNLIVFSGIALLVILILDLLANMIEIYFNVGGIVEEHMRASIWARALDWAAAAGSVVAFASYRSLGDSTLKLLQAATGAPLVIAPGNVASGLFGAVVGTTIAGAIINTIMTAGDGGNYAYLAAKMMKPGADVSDADLGKFRDAMLRRRAAYEAFP
ncbi:hypothetical protein B0H67DRAFT_294853 [Lasiosphaeris hirsuta]|uniref:Uncharacterized protein n=1 Tax=Lasiosphaeris hirsuta TaxID=260670 RepID=A0AA40A956_9PEZI|nr:hypothetical protein B0H67DRAFT_294853 [Lasiosphaeris hirsuta]